MKEKPTSDETTVAIEQNIEKNNRRTEIVTQIMDMIIATGKRNLKLATLPAENWLFEHQLINALEISRLRKKPELLFHGVEFDEDIALLSIKNKPENARLFNTSLHYMLTRKHVERKSKVNYVIEGEREIGKYDVIFADYCGQPNNILIKHVGEYMSMIESGMLYVTFNIDPRPKTFEAFCSDLKLSSRNIAKSLSNRLIQIARRKRKTTKSIVPVYNVMYRGGSQYSSNMITIGFAIGKVSARKIRTIIKDVKVNETRRHNGAIYQAYLRKPSLLKGSKPYLKSLKKSTSTTISTDKQKAKVKALLDKGLDNAVIAKRVGISKKCVGSISAHHCNPNSWGNLGRKKKKRKVVK